MTRKHGDAGVGMRLRALVAVPFWAAGVGYVIIDLLGTFNPASNVGHFAHLSGVALGLWYGWTLKKRAQRRSVAWVGT